MCWGLATILLVGGSAVEASLDKSNVTVGELIRYQLVVYHDDTLAVPTPQPAAPRGVKLAATEAPSTAQDRPGTARTTFRYALAAYEPGTYVLPPTDVVLMDQHGGSHSLATDTLFFSVRSVLESSADTTDIRDLKDPLPPGWAPPPWALAAAGAAVIATVAFGALKARKRAPRPATPPPSPEAVARERLRRLRGVVPTDDEALKAYYSEISYVLRDYIEQTLAVPALESTTGELLRSAERIPHARRWAARLGRLLDESDLVKFAKHVPTVGETRQALGSAEEVVETIRREEAARSVVLVDGTAGSGSEA